MCNNCKIQNELAYTVISLKTIEVKYSKNSIPYPFPCINIKWQNATFSTKANAPISHVARSFEVKVVALVVLVVEVTTAAPAAVASEVDAAVATI